MKNQTLEIGSYLIPEGCKATVMGGEVIISIKKRAISVKGIKA